MLRCVRPIKQWHVSTWCIQWDVFPYLHAHGQGMWEILGMERCTEVHFFSPFDYFSCNNDFPFPSCHRIVCQAVWVLEWLASRSWSKGFLEGMAEASAALMCFWASFFQNQCKGTVASPCRLCWRLVSSTDSLWQSSKVKQQFVSGLVRCWCLIPLSMDFRLQRVLSCPFNC